MHKPNPAHQIEDCQLATLMAGSSNSNSKIKASMSCDATFFLYAYQTFPCSAPILMASSSGFVLPRLSTHLPIRTSDNALPIRQPQSTSKPAPVVDLPALQNASRVLQDQFLKDSQIIPDLGDTLTTRMYMSISVIFISFDGE